MLSALSKHNLQEENKKIKLGDIFLKRSPIFLWLSQVHSHYLLTFSWHAPALFGAACFRCVAFLF